MRVLICKKGVKNMDKSIGNIYQTRNYSQFVLPEWNRDKDERALRKIDKKVSEIGWRTTPIFVNEKNEVIDGQHRLIYAKEHQLPVYYLQIKGANKSDCQMMNNAKTTWTLKDYVKFYASDGNENYIRLQKLCFEYSFLSTTNVCSVAMNNSSGNCSCLGLKDGRIILSERDYKIARVKLDFLKTLEPYIRKAKGRSIAIYQAVLFCYECPLVDNERLVRQIKSKIETIIPPANLEYALKEIEKLYNYKIAKDKYVFVFTEYLKTHSYAKKNFKMEDLEDDN